MDRLADKALIREAIDATKGKPQKKKSCNCISEIEQRVAQEKGADLVQLEHFGSQSSEISYTNYKPNSIVFKRRHYTSIDWTYCPFCGVKI